jgi:predicted HTH transcriptional regulator
LSSAPQKIYEDEYLIVVKGYNQTEVNQIVLEYIRKKGSVTFREMRQKFTPLIGEDRLRKAIRDLIGQGYVMQYKWKYYKYLPKLLRQKNK